MLVKYRKNKYEILDFISKFEKGVHYARIRDYAKEKLGISSRGTVSQYLRVFKEDGWTEKDRLNWHRITAFGIGVLNSRKEYMRNVGGYEEPHELRTFTIRAVKAAQRKIEDGTEELVDTLKDLGFARYSIDEYTVHVDEEPVKTIALTGPGPFRTEEQSAGVLGLTLPVVEISVSRKFIIFYTYLPKVPKGPPSLESIFTKKEVSEILEKWADLTELYLRIMFKIIFEPEAKLCPMGIEHWVRPTKVVIGKYVGGGLRMSSWSAR